MTSFPAILSFANSSVAAQSKFLITSKRVAGSKRNPLNIQGSNQNQDKRGYHQHRRQARDERLETRLAHRGQLCFQTNASHADRDAKLGNLLSHSGELKIVI